MEERIIDLDTARNILASLAGTTEVNSEPTDLLVAEYLRTSLCSLSFSDDPKIARPVYVTELTNRVRWQLGSVWPEIDRIVRRLPSVQQMEIEGDTEPDTLRRVLESLEDIGDFARLSGGYWLPSPVRFIQLIPNNILVVGGLSSHALRKSFPVSVSSDSLVRSIREEEITEAFRAKAESWQSLDSWLGDVSFDLHSWLAETWKIAGENLSDSGSEMSNVDVYVPNERPTSPQYFRWIRLSEMQRKKDELILCRSRQGRIKLPRSYWLGRFEKGTDGNFYMTKEFPVEGSNVRRLQYALDSYYRCPTTAIVDMSEAEFTVTLRSWLPPEGRRLFLALGAEKSEKRARLPLKYGVGSDWYPAIERYLKSLGMLINSI